MNGTADVALSIARQKLGDGGDALDEYARGIVSETDSELDLDATNTTTGSDPREWEPAHCLCRPSRDGANTGGGP